ncbi:MAG: hypothetical protein IPK16_09615 [Anaerolineales bacterium]|nr:hypothetical protein [Anaerolineales bacterium]
MGKDSPGSPITDAGRFLSMVAWELNYRGELEFLHQAERHRRCAGCTSKMAGAIFCFGWSQVISRSLAIDIHRRRLSSWPPPLAIYDS